MKELTRSAQLSDIRQENYSTIMRELMRSGPTARTDLAASIGVSTGSVTRLTGALVRSGLLLESDEPAQGGGTGRPKVPVAIDRTTYGVIGVHFGLRRVNICLTDLSGELLAEAHTTERVVYDVFELAGNGDARARRLLQERAGLVGTATATLIEVLDPELVVIGGGIAAPVDNVSALRDTALAKLAVDRGSDVAARIQASAFGPHALGIAAAAIMLDAVYRSPEEYVPALTAP